MNLLSLVFGFLAFLRLCLPASAVRLIESNALNICQDSSNFTATYFNVLFTPDNRTLTFSFDGVASISGKVTADLTLYVYGYAIPQKTIDPCKTDKMKGFCPMNAGPIDVPTASIEVGEDVVRRIPGIAYTVPDLDATVRIYVNSSATGESITCVEARLSNDKTVYQAGVGWTTAIISGLGLAASAFTSTQGHSNAAAHLAGNTLALFSFVQAQAMVGMLAVHMPPMVQSWTQNFQWSMGLIRVGAVQKIGTWYQRSTGGVPSTLLMQLTTTSVNVLKKRAVAEESSTNVIVRGIKRVGLKAAIEDTNLFLTSVIIFTFFALVVMIIVLLMKVVCAVLAKKGRTGPAWGHFLGEWDVVARGVLYRLVFIGFAPLSTFCLWEFTQRDSPAEIVVAAIILASISGALVWAAVKIILLMQKSISMHRNPAYVLYSDTTCLNRWGFLYVQYRATAASFILVVIGYLFVKALFISLGQTVPIVQTVALLVLEGLMLIGVSVVRPWMDKRTNTYNIAIAAVNFLNAIFVLFFSGVFDQPGIVSGVMGVCFFVINAALTLVLILLVIYASVMAVISKSPDTHYKPMQDDRGSFIQSQARLGPELDDLSAAARGGMVETKY
ncbi:hypothetical protein KXV31_009434 [Aspergillus fumigatus]|nr:hypothetical protein KXX14_008196 [Aspergillus fumigatus]KAH1458256.1 hypothetical protein KXX58_009480 [Aspergillus fumigatus]KAH2008859.1 hypothetical protein KXV45_008558 [Aspergillus fumigatus]KAH2079513.1 hypothetical protein KXX03_005076 [Aspergillus fumigatus]KAH2236160.1 hypothetical protein KXW71_005156 [Aspergillus fumigatus]